MPVGLLPIFCFCCNDPTHSYVTFSAKTQLESILVDVLFLSFCFRNFFATQKKEELKLNGQKLDETSKTDS